MIEYSHYRNTSILQRIFLIEDIYKLARGWM